MPGTRKLGRTTEHRMSMLKGMVTYLLENGKIETTVTRAKEVSALADKMITLGKENTLASKRRAMAFLKKEEVVYKLFTAIAPFYSARNGGYTAVYKLGPRRGDGAEMAVIVLVEADELYKKNAKDDKKAAKKAEKKAEAPKEEKAVEVEAPATEKKPAAKRTTKKAATEGEAKPAAKRTTKKKAETEEKAE